MPKKDDSQTSTPRLTCTAMLSAVTAESCHATMTVNKEAADAVAKSRSFLDGDFLMLNQNASPTAAQRRVSTMEMSAGYHFEHQATLNGWYAISNNSAAAVLQKNHGSLVW